MCEGRTIHLNGVEHGNWNMGNGNMEKMEWKMAFEWNMEIGKWKMEWKMENGMENGMEVSPPV